MYVVKARERICSVAKHISNTISLDPCPRFGSDLPHPILIVRPNIHHICEMKNGLEAKRNLPSCALLSVFEPATCLQASASTEALKPTFTNTNTNTTLPSAKCVCRSSYYLVAVQYQGQDILRQRLLYCAFTVYVICSSRR